MYIYSDLFNYNQTKKKIKYIFIFNIYNTNIVYINNRYIRDLTIYNINFILIYETRKYTHNTNSKSCFINPIPRSLQSI